MEDDWGFAFDSGETDPNKPFCVDNTVATTNWGIPGCASYVHKQTAAAGS